MMVLGIPGDVLTAILLGALMIQGLAPGPLLFTEHSTVVSGIFASFFVAQVIMLVMGLIAVRIAGKIVHVPTPILLPIVLVLCAIGGYATNNSSFDLWVMTAFGFLGYLMLKGGFPLPPMLLAIILGPLAESNFRRTLSISRNDLSVFITSPIAASILVISLLIIIKVAYDEFRRNRTAQSATSCETGAKEES